MAEFIPLGNDTTLNTYFGWAGKAFPYAGTEDITIAEDTIWNDAVGYKKVKKLTIEAGKTLKINKTPFYIFAEEIEFGDEYSCIDASGLNTGVPFSAAGGGDISESSTGRAGDGGGMLFVVVKKISGAAGIIKANGADGIYSVNTVSGGQGALSHRRTVSGTSPTASEHWTGSFGSSSNSILPLGHLLAGGSQGGTGGGSGFTQSSGNYAGGGSGIGGGGSNYGPEYHGGASNGITVSQLLCLADMGCRGGGGGGYGGGKSAGGGGGSVVVWVREMLSAPVLQANGGLGTAGAGNGGAGVTHLIEV